MRRDVRCIHERVDALDRMVMQMIRDRDERTDATLTAAKEATEKAHEANERRLDLLNEFRAQAADEAAHYARREVVEKSLQALDDRITANASALSHMRGRAAALAAGGAVLGAITAIAVASALGAGP